MRGAAVAGHDHVLAHAAGTGAAALERAHAQLGERLHQSEAGGLVVGERKATRHRALVGSDPDGAGLGDEIADREHQAVIADDDAVAGALGAEDLRGEGIVGYFGPQTDDGFERAPEVEAPLLGPRPHLDRKGPFALFARHTQF